MKKTFYITTTLPYVNAKPHIGFAMEIIRADVMARFYRKKLGKENVFFNTGTDEHGQKIHQKAVQENKDPQKYCDEYAEKFQGLKQLLNLSYDNFIRTTDPHHIEAAQEFWKLCDKNDYIYKKNYKVKYCVGCELEKTDSELVDGKCPLHPDQNLEIIEEENYFFRFSAFKEKLLDFYKSNPEFVLPKKRFNEIIRFVEDGPQDFSISRLKSKMPWGVPVPGDPDQVMYVWFDALVNYISAIDWPSYAKASEGKPNRFKKFWPGAQVCGKDNLRQQSAMWQAMLMAAGLPNSERVFVNGFINVNGQKMSKSLGNVILPEQMVEKFGVDGTRYLLLSFGPFGEDWDVSWEKFTEKYNADLANGLGNLVSRVVKLAGKVEGNWGDLGNWENKEEREEFFETGRLELALEKIWKKISIADKMMENKKPWELVKDNQDEFEKVMHQLATRVFEIADDLEVFFPESAEKIKKAIKNKKIEPLFKRI